MDEQWTYGRRNHEHYSVRNHGGLEWAKLRNHGGPEWAKLLRKLGPPCHWNWQRNQNHIHTLPPKAISVNLVHSYIAFYDRMVDKGVSLVWRFLWSVEKLLRKIQRQAAIKEHSWRWPTLRLKPGKREGRIGPLHSLAWIHLGRKPLQALTLTAYVNLRSCLHLWDDF